MRFLIDLARRDLAASGRSLWVFRICLALGVALVAATGGLYQQVGNALLDDTRALLGGDLEVQSRSPLPDEVLEWMRERGRLSLLIELRTMLRTESGGLSIVELQSVDDNYPLYGELRLEPAMSSTAATALVDGRYGIAIDPVLATRLQLGIGDEVGIGVLAMEVRALIAHQPDRALNADWRGAPVLIGADALAQSALVTPASRMEYEYRVRIDGDAEDWRERFEQAFVDGEYELRTFAGRSERIAERLAQVASALLIIGFSTLFIGGLGVFNSIQAYLQGKLTTIATLRALGMRNHRLAWVYLLQVGMLATMASVAGALAGFVIAVAGARFAVAGVPVSEVSALMLAPMSMAIAFGLLTAFTFSLPAIGRALSVDPAALFRGIDGFSARTPRRWWYATLAGCVAIAMLVLLALPDPLFGLGFLIVVLVLLGVLELMVRGLRRLTRKLESHPLLDNFFALRLAAANVNRPGSPLRTSLLSLGSALTLLVACAIVVGALLDTIRHTIPEQSPALVLYDIQADQLSAVGHIPGLADPAGRADFAPLVLGRLTAVNGEALRDSEDPERRREARNEHKLTYRANNIDSVTLDRGRWWDDAAGGMRVAMEDHEADKLGLRIGDQLTFTIVGMELPATLDAIYRQKGMQTRFWFEVIASDGSLDAFIHRYVGAAWMSDAAAIDAQRQIADIAPNIVSVRTASILSTARELLGRASAALAAVAAVSLVVGLLVLTGVMATQRARQVYDATILHALGARLSVIRRSLQLEYLLLASITSVFAIAAGLAIAMPLLAWRLRIVDDYPLWPAIVVAVGVSVISLHLGARYLLRRLRLNPAALLRGGG